MDVASRCGGRCEEEGVAGVMIRGELFPQWGFCGAGSWHSCRVSGVVRWPPDCRGLGLLGVGFDAELTSLVI